MLHVSSKILDICRKLFFYLHSIFGQKSVSVVFGSAEAVFATPCVRNVAKAKHGETGAK